ncbi:hypothetical protein ACFL2Q_09980 [Thermodesulfobacteriota bacterium]
MRSLVQIIIGLTATVALMVAVTLLNDREQCEASFGGVSSQNSHWFLT